MRREIGRGRETPVLPSKRKKSKARHGGSRAEELTERLQQDKTAGKMKLMRFNRKPSG
jgi:hypothetical protein